MTALLPMAESAPASVSAVRTQGALRIVMPDHQLVICGHPDGKAGSCRCGAWAVVGPLSSDDVSRLFVRHLESTNGVSEASCDRCQTGVATVRHGAVELCARCALDDLQTAATVTA